MRCKHESWRFMYSDSGSGIRLEKCEKCNSVRVRYSFLGRVVTPWRVILRKLPRRWTE